jgi:hypothetical protein
MNRAVVDKKTGAFEYFGFKPEVPLEQQQGGKGYLIKRHVAEEHLFNTEIGKSLKRLVDGMPGHAEKIVVGALGDDGKCGHSDATDFGHPARVITLPGASANPRVVPHRQTNDNNCAAVATLIAMNLCGAEKIAQKLLTGKKKDGAELRKGADANGFKVLAAKDWCDKIKVNPRYKYLLSWLFVNPKVYAKEPIAIYLDLENGFQKHAVTIFDGFYYDPNNSLALPFDRAHLDKKYTGVSEGYQFSISKKALNKIRA